MPGGRGTAAPEGRRWIVRYALVASAVFAAFCVVFLLVPSIRFRMAEEGHVPERLSELFYLVSVVMGIVVLRREHERFGRVFAAVPILGALGLLEETNYGLYVLKRFVPFEFPTLYGWKIDSPADFIEATIFGLKQGSVGAWAAAGLFALAGIILTVALVSRAPSPAEIRNTLSRSPSVRFIFICAGLILVAKGLDIRTVFASSYETSSRYVEEVLEMLAALALVFACLQERERRKPTPPGLP